MAKATTTTIKTVKSQKAPATKSQKALGKGFADFMNEDTVVTTPSIESREIRIGATTKKVAGCAAILGAGILIGTKLS